MCKNLGLPPAKMVEKLRVSGDLGISLIFKFYWVFVNGFSQCFNVGE